MNDSNYFIHEDPWRIFRIMAEFVDSFQTMSQAGPAVTIFGSARTKPNDKYYRAAVAIGKGLAKHKLAVITGGGPGIMEAANLGAHEAGGKTVGLNIRLPFEQLPNPYITPELNLEFHYFFMRKYWFAYLAKALVVFPGGFGTLDEMFEILTLAQTEKLAKHIIVIIYGRQYWNRVLNLDALVESGTISPQDRNLFRFADTPEEAFRLLKSDLTQHYLQPHTKDDEPNTPEIAKTRP